MPDTGYSGRVSRYKPIKQLKKTRCSDRVRKDQEIIITIVMLHTTSNGIFIGYLSKYENHFSF